MILDQIKRHGLDCEIDIQRTVQRVRARRSGMVHCMYVQCTIVGTTPYHKLLNDFRNITRPDGQLQEIKHCTVHHIETTLGPPRAGTNPRPQQIRP